MKRYELFLEFVGKGDLRPIRKIALNLKNWLMLYEQQNLKQFRKLHTRELKNNEDSDWPLL